MIFLGLLLIVLGIFFWITYGSSKVAEFSELRWIDESFITKIERTKSPFSHYDTLRFHTRHGEVWDYSLKTIGSSRINMLFEKRDPPYPTLRIMAFPQPSERNVEHPIHYVVLQIADASGVLSAYEDNAEEMGMRYRNFSYLGAIFMLIGLLFFQLARIPKSKKNRHGTSRLI